MTNQNELLVMARYRDTSQGVKFSGAMPLRELMSRMISFLPCDSLFVLVPDSDGKGYSLREVGLLTLSVGQPVDVALPSVAAPELHSPPILLPIDKQSEIKLTSLVAQKEPAPKRSKAIKPNKKAKKKETKPEDRWLEGVPSPTATKGEVKITSIRQATQAEQMAASRIK